MRGRPDRYTDGSDPLSDPKKVRRLVSVSRPGAAMLAVVVVVVGLVITLSQLTGNDDTDGAPSEVAGEEQQQTPQSGGSEGGSDAPLHTESEDGDAQPEAVPEEAVETAIEFTGAWKLDASEDERREALSEVASPNLTDALLLVRSSDLSDGDIVGDPEPVAFSDVFANLNVTLSTGEVIAVSVAQQADGEWLAVDVQSVREPDAEDESEDESGEEPAGDAANESEASGPARAKEVDANKNRKNSKRARNAKSGKQG